MGKNQDQYAALGVDAGKEAVRAAFGEKTETDFPGAFVNIIRDPEVLDQVLTQHNDGDGSKLLQRFLMTKEGGLPSVLRGAVDDGLTMNMGDIGAAGFVSGLILVTDVINVNGKNISKDVLMEEIAQRFQELIKLYRSWGFDIHFLGGETADLPYQVKTAVFDVAVSARAREGDIIKGNVEVGDCIWGMASDGQAIWEEKPNSGLMSNGLTLAWSALMSTAYNKKYPELIVEGVPYRGRFLVGDTDPLLKEMTVDEALTSPTRQWAIFIKILIKKLKGKNLFQLLHGITLNSGGGATKVMHIGTGGITFKKKMPMPPAIFQLIKRETSESWMNMFKSFNCGVGLDIIGENDFRLADVLEEVSEQTGIKVFELGECFSSGCDGNEVILDTPFGVFSDY